jgi:hypothetical protein
MFKLFTNQLIKGLLLAVLYLELTNANDTTYQNIFLFTIFYISMVYGAILTGIDPNVITSAFLTKAVFTLVDEKIKRQDQTNNSKK